MMNNQKINYEVPARFEEICYNKYYLKYRLASMFVFLSVLIVLCILHFGSISSVPTEQQEYRLPEDLHPQFYRLNILTNLAQLNENFTFTGSIAIKIYCEKDTNRIILHSKNLTIDEDKVLVNKIAPPPENVEIKISEHLYQYAYDFYIIVLSDTLKAGNNYSLIIPFQGVLTQGLAGYYRSSYIDSATKETRWLAVTQFSPTDARRAFPCFDEPSFKAQFQLSIGHKLTHQSHSNTEIESTQKIDALPGWVWDNYKVTLRMSTYLIGYMVADFGFREPAEQGNVLFKVWTRQDALNQVEFAAASGPKLLKFCEEYFKILYPLPKVDMAAIPDFHFNAMENWGLITFRETALLFDANYSSIKNLQSIAFTMGHEIVHQWFGNLVTMKWWSDLWLKEGFATYIGSLAVQNIHPEWNALNTEAVYAIMKVLDFDCLNSSHPISQTLENPQDIPQIFDSISYQKGSTVLRMISHLLGSETFRDGINYYLEKFKYSNAAKDDLWASLTEIAIQQGVLPSDGNVKTIMDTWTLQTGYPVATVTRNYKDGTASITQRRFMLENITLEQQPCWHILLTYTTSDDLSKNKKVWMECNSSQKSVVISNLPENELIIFNLNMSGLYRTNYDQNNWKLISQMLRSEKYSLIPTLSRVQILCDVLSLSRTGEVSYVTSIELVSYLSRETEYLPWYAGIKGLYYIRKMLFFSPEDFEIFQIYMSDIMLPIYDRLSNVSYPHESENLDALRFQEWIVSSACELGIGDCVSRAVKLFKEWMSVPDPDIDNPIFQDNRETVYTAAIAEGGETEWNFLWERFLKANAESERVVIMRALASTKIESLLKQYLEWSINETSGIRFHQSGEVFVAVASEPVGYPLARQFFFSRFLEIYNYYTLKLQRLSNYVSAVCALTTTDEEYNELKQFFKDHASYLKDNELAVQQGLEQARINVEWQHRFRGSILNTMTTFHLKYKV